MGRRRKNRTHLKDPNIAAAANPTPGGTTMPKSFVVKHGQVGSSIAQLVRDMRKVMEPNTATRLRVRSACFLRNWTRLI
jgi:ribosome biogenesis protein SSF1/2